MIARLLARYRIRRLRIDENAKCPACGHRLGMIRTVEIDTPKGARSIEHTCLVCLAKFYEPTIVNPEKWVALSTLVSCALQNSTNPQS